MMRKDMCFNRMLSVYAIQSLACALHNTSQDKWNVHGRLPGSERDD